MKFFNNKEILKNYDKSSIYVFQIMIFVELRLNSSIQCLWMKRQFNQELNEFRLEFGDFNELSETKNRHFHLLIFKLLLVLKTNFAQLHVAKWNEMNSSNTD